MINGLITWLSSIALAINMHYDPWQAVESESLLKPILSAEEVQGEDILPALILYSTNFDFGLIYFSSM